jgi:hypothetical protein
MKTETPEVQEKPKMTMYEIQDMIFNVLSSAEIQFESLEEADDKKAFSDYVSTMLEELGIREAEKADAFAYAIRMAETRAAFFKQEAELFTQKRQVIERRIKSMKENISFVMDRFGLKKISGKRYSITLTHSKAVIITGSVSLLPKKYLEKKVEFNAKKKEIKEALESGKKIDGVILELRTSITIR